MREAVAHVRADEGFTLTELVAIGLIVALLLGIALVSYTASARAAEAATCRHNRQTLEQVVDVNGCRQDGTPFMSLDDLAVGVSDFDDIKRCPTDGDLLLFNSQTGNVTCPNHR